MIFRSAPRRLASLALAPVMALAAFIAPASAHPGHGDAHAEPWYNQPLEGVPSAAPSPENATPATVEGKTLRSAEPDRLVEDSPERAPASESTPAEARDGQAPR